MLQDGQIDSGEFATMIRNGNGGTGRQNMRSTLNFKDGLRLMGNGSNQVIDGHL